MTPSQVAAVPATTGADAPARRADDRAKIAELAAEFESLLLVNVLREMRSSGRWNEPEETNMLGGETFEQTIDVELSRYLSNAGGMGLAQQLLQAFDRLAGHDAPPQVSANDGVSPPTTAPLATDGRVTSSYGWRRDPFTGASRFHRGVDLSAEHGDIVATTAGGRVSFSGSAGGYGTTVVVEHAGGVQTRYAHLSATLVQVGDWVDQGQPIGRAGQTGRATAPHLHYEVLVNGQAVDPLTR